MLLRRTSWPFEDTGYERGRSERGSGETVVLAGHVRAMLRPIKERMHVYGMEGVPPSDASSQKHQIP